jgi:hypothetical protein
MNPIYAQQFHDAVVVELRWWNNASPRERVKKMQGMLALERSRRKQLREKLLSCDDYWVMSTYSALQMCQDEIKSLMERISYFRKGGKTLWETIHAK